MCRLQAFVRKRCKETTSTNLGSVALSFVVQTWCTPFCKIWFFHNTHRICNIVWEGNLSVFLVKCPDLVSPAFSTNLPTKVEVRPWAPKTCIWIWFWRVNFSTTFWYLRAIERPSTLQARWLTYQTTETLIQICFKLMKASQLVRESWKINEGELRLQSLWACVLFLL